MKKGTICIIMGLLLFAVALSLIGYNLWDNYRAGVKAQDILEQLIPEIEKDSIPEEIHMMYKQTEEQEETQQIIKEEMEYPDYILNPKMEMPTEQIDGREYIGVLNIPAIDLELPVCSEWNTNNLSYSPCRYLGSAYLDDMIICAHNFETFFRDLKNLSYGDTVEFTDMDGNVFRYRVTEILNILPTAVSEMTSGDWDLTLFTCTPGAAYRVTVRCERG